MPKSVPRESVGGFHHLPALSPLSCLWTVRIPILSDGVRFLVIVLISILPVITQDSELPVLWPFVVLFFFFHFFLLKGVRKIYLRSWLLESQLCLKFISTIAAPGPFLRVGVINTSR